MKKAKRNAVIALAVSLVVMCGILAVIAPRYGSFAVYMPLEHKPAFDQDTGAYPDHLRAEATRWWMRMDKL